MFPRCCITCFSLDRFAGRFVHGGPISVLAPPLGDGLHLLAAVLGDPRRRRVPLARHLPPARDTRRPQSGRRRARASRGRRRPRGRGGRERRARPAGAGEREHAASDETRSGRADGGGGHDPAPGPGRGGRVWGAAGGRALARHLDLLACERASRA